MYAGDDLMSDMF